MRAGERERGAARFVDPSEQAQRQDSGGLLLGRERAWCPGLCVELL